MLTPAQQASVKSLITTTPAMNAKPNNEDGAFDIAVLLNAVASPAYVVWRTSVTIEEIMNNGFAWDRVDNATVGQARIWQFMAAQGTINPSRANVRAGIDAAWPGTGNQAQRDGIYSHCTRNASVVEKLLATGSGTAASPSTMGFVGPISMTDVLNARNSA